MSVLLEIDNADRSVLVARWQTLFDREPPPRVHTGLLRRVLAWHAQMEAAGLEAFPSSSQQGGGQTKNPTPNSPVLSVGTRLLREWQGTTHEVRVLPQGFDYAGKTYKSLTAIARAITGTPWSGPAFFGVKR